MLAAASSSSMSYTAGITEEKCVLEEEFHGASSLSTHNDEHAWWDDDETDYYADTATDSKQSHTSKHRYRWRVWKNNKASPDHAESSPLNADMPATSVLSLDAEHPMRTDEWEFNIQLSRLFPQEVDLFPEYMSSGDSRNKRRFRKRQVMQFARNGYVKIMQDELLSSNNMDASFVSSAPKAEGKRSQVHVGKWRIAHSGVVFDIPVNIGVDEGDTKKMTVLHYHADIHLNKFGEQPRMFRGVITRDRLVPHNIARLLYIKLFA